MSVTTRIEKIGTSSVNFYQELKRGETLLVKAKTIWACVNSETKSQAVPQALKQALLS